MISFAAVGRHCWRGLIVAILLASESPAGLSFEFRYVDDAQGTFASRGWLNPNSLFQRNIAAAASLWGDEFASNETIIVRVDPMSFAARAGGTPTLGRSLYTNAQGQDVWEAGPLTRILTSSNPGEMFYGYDLVLGFDAAFVENNYWLDPEPELRVDPVPLNKGDFVSVALHELGHGFGMAGFRDFPTGEISGDNTTQMDYLSYFGGNGAPIGPGGERNAMYFNGETAARLYGRDLPLTHKPTGHPLYSQNYYHISDCDADGLASTLMNGCAVPLGERMQITPFDLAVYADMGYPMAKLFGDFNSDAGVDASDYVVWRKLLGTTYTEADYNIWRLSFGSSMVSGAPMHSYIPELPTCALLVFAAIFLLARRRKSCS
jgi:hypothetical protein